jgi:hypothetical protein
MAADERRNVYGYRGVHLRRDHDDVHADLL